MSSRNPFPLFILAKKVYDFFAMGVNMRAVEAPKKEYYAVNRFDPVRQGNISVLIDKASDGDKYSQECISKALGRPVQFFNEVDYHTGDVYSIADYKMHLNHVLLYKRNLRPYYECLDLTNPVALGVKEREVRTNREAIKRTQSFMDVVRDTYIERERLYNEIIIKYPAYIEAGIYPDGVISESEYLNKALKRSGHTFIEWRPDSFPFTTKDGYTEDRIVFCGSTGSTLRKYFRNELRDEVEPKYFYIDEPTEYNFDVYKTITENGTIKFTRSDLGKMNQYYMEKAREELEYSSRCMPITMSYDDFKHNLTLWIENSVKPTKENKGDRKSFYFTRRKYLLLYLEDVLENKRKMMNSAFTFEDLNSFNKREDVIKCMDTNN